jgi:hypothetical protein
LRYLKFIVLVLFPAWAVSHAAAQGQDAYSADQVKAAFLYNFGGFVEWPSEARMQEGIVIGVLGDEAVESELRRNVAGRTLENRPVSVRHVENAEQAAGVHILFVGARENARLPSLLAALRARPILVVTEAREALEQGAVINFVVTNRVQFEVSLPAAARARLRLSPRLLQVAVRVQKGEWPSAPTFAYVAF